MNKIGYSFKNKTLLDLALTHSSYGNENHCPCNERLEFLGDSVLSIIISEYLFLNMPDVDEGKLSKVRASLVCEQTLSKFSKAMNIGELIKLGKGEATTGGRSRASILSDAFEAILAAIYLDSDMATAKKWVLEKMKNMLKLAVEGKTYKDYKTILQEHVQKTGGTISYKVIFESGPDHNKDFLVEVIVNGEKKASAHGMSKKDAEQNAAKKVLVEFGYEIL